VERFGYAAHVDRDIAAEPVVVAEVASQPVAVAVEVQPDRRLTVAYVMNKMVPCMIVEPIAAALVERVYDIVNRYALPWR
jgi:hypothetical protein